MTVISKIKVGIIEANKEIRNRLSSMIDASEFAEVEFSIADGMNAVELIYESNPEILVVDETLPFRSGIDIITEISTFERKPYIIYTLPMNNDILISRAVGAGVSEVVIKPYDESNIVSRIQHICDSANPVNSFVVFESVNGLREKIMEYDSYSNIDRRREEDFKLSRFVTDMLLKDGFSKKHNGFSYIVLAATLMYRRWPHPYSLSNDIYPAIQDTYDINYDMTECSIRTAIKRAWENHIKSGAESTGVFSNFTKRPSNNEFLEMLTNMMYASGIEI